MQARDALMKEKETSEKVEARAFAKNYVQQLMPTVFSSLNSAGYFYDQQERGEFCFIIINIFIIILICGFLFGCSLTFEEIENVFVPWLLDRVDEKLALTLRARSVLDGKRRNQICIDGMNHEP